MADRNRLTVAVSGDTISRQPKDQARSWRRWTMPVFFNNCRRRDHAGLFGAGAFYDLDRDGRQAKMATNLRRGDECVVATPDADGDIVFSWFAFSHEAVMPAESDVGVRVLFGD